MKKSEETKINFAEWLEKLQQESWQLELLISGFAIFGLFELLNFVETYISTSFLVLLILEISSKAIYIFIVNLLIHVFLRALWIGAIGLRYVSGDIDYDKLNYSPPFTNYFQRKIGDFDSYIEKLEQWASVLFSYTFLLFFMFFSFFFFFIVTIFLSTILFNLLGGSAKTGLTNFRIENTPEDSLWLFIALGLSLLNLLFAFLVLFDFVTIGALKKIKNRYFARGYLFIYRYISFVSLSFIWRPLLLNFLDKKFTRRLFAISVPYVILLTMILPSTRYSFTGFYPTNRDLINKEYPDIHLGNSYRANFYADELEKKAKHISRVIRHFNIPSKRVNGRLFEIFLKYDEFNEALIMGQDTSLKKITKEGIIINKFLEANFDDSLDMQPVLDKIETQNIKDEATIQQMKEDFIKDFQQQEKTQYQNNYDKIKQRATASFLLEIDHQRIDPNTIVCDYYTHPNLQEKGMLCFFPLDSMALGRHHLTVGRIQLQEMEAVGLDTTWLTIPFVYEGE